jgi:hypothetical protein
MQLIKSLCFNCNAVAEWAKGVTRVLRCDQASPNSEFLYFLRYWTVFVHRGGSLLAQIRKAYVIIRQHDSVHDTKHVSAIRALKILLWRHHVVGRNIYTNNIPFHDERALE